MPNRKTPLITGEIYHIVLRGIEGRTLFQDESDYYRAVHDLYEFNDKKPVDWRFRHNYDSRHRRIRELLVELFAFCLMPNHIHLLLRQLPDNGISFFMKKFGGGYANYFNQKYERRGYLFQGRFLAVHINDNQQLKHDFVYIHTNPAALADPGWQEGSIKNPEEVIKYIENYKWSSYRDYLNKKNFPSLIKKDFFNHIMTRKEWQEYVNDWIRYKTVFNFTIPDIVI